MDFDRKSSNSYKNDNARRVIDVGNGGSCKDITTIPDIQKQRGKDIFDGASGISVAGIQTNIAIPAIGVTLDAGASVDKFLERDLVISHFDSDHVEGVGRAICAAINRDKNLDIFMPSMDDHPEMRKAVNVFMDQDKNHVVKIHEMHDGTRIKFKDRRKMIEAFKVTHAPESIGYSIWTKDGMGWKRKLTYPGDIDVPKTDTNRPQFTDPETIVIEASYSGMFLPFLGPFLDLFTPHTDTFEIRDVISRSRVKNVGIIHLPPATSCLDIANDIRVKMKHAGKKLYYLPSCSDADGINPLKNARMFTEI